ncbi:MAG TPA: XRE family transcriptional regulator [Bryocella sp.]|nr:XRE family transcriptional regulator [Bryocella sp.]
MNSGVRIRQVRELLGKTQTEFADLAGVSQPAIAQLEAGSTAASEQTLQNLSLNTGFPVEFFKAEPRLELPLGSLLYRAHVGASTKERARAYRLAQLLYEFIESVSEEIERPPVRLPRLSTDPTLGAHLTRSAMGHAPDVPIPNLINSIERAGVIVLSLPVATEKIDAFSVWAGPTSEQPLIGVVTNKPPDRLRFSVAHELGHLVLHHPLRVSPEEAERQAHQFAAELLLPETVMRSEITTPITLSSLAPLKPKWRVSIQALIRRSFDLQMISERQYRYLFEQLSARGMRRDEGVPIATELPRGLRKIVEVLYGSDVSPDRLAKLMGLPISITRNILDSHSRREDLESRRAPRLLRFDQERIQ